jgi:Tol biopolymer transport system component
MRRWIATAAALATLLLFATGAPASEPANGGSGAAAISADGRYVAFESAASNLVAGDGNGADDIFVRDRAAGTTLRVSVGPQNLEANASSAGPAISADGRVVAFTSLASNLVPGDTNDERDVFVHDRLTGATERINVGIGGAQANDESALPSISADGRLVAFLSYASNLVSGDVAGTWDVFVRDRAGGTTERVNVSSEGVPANPGKSVYTKATISAGGRFVAFSSDASNLVAGDTNVVADTFVRDRVGGTTERVSVGTGGSQISGESGLYGAAISADGRFVAFASIAPDVVAGDTNGSYDIFLRDRVAGTTERISVASDGSQGNGGSWDRPRISADGRFVAFNSFATNLVLGDTNGKTEVFLRDRAAGTTERVSVGESGEATESSGAFGISSDGRLVLLASLAPNLVAGDTNGATDVFVRDRSSARTELVSVAKEPRPAAGRPVLKPRPPQAGRVLTVTMALSANGRAVTEAKIAGVARIAGRRLPVVRKSFAEGTARFVWRLPNSARKKRVTGSITATTAGGSVTRTFHATVR